MISQPWLDLHLQRRYGRAQTGCDLRQQSPVILVDLQQSQAALRGDRQRQHPGNQLCGSPGGRAGLLLQAQRDHHVSRRLVRRQALHLLHQGLKVLPAGQHGIEEQKSRTIGSDGAVGKALDVAEQTLQGLCRDGNLRVQVLQQLPQGGAGPMEGLRLPDAPGL